MRCATCGRAMEPVERYYRKKTGEKSVACYYRCREGNRRKTKCQNGKSIRSDWAHAAVWELVSGLLSDPQRLRTGLERMIEEEQAQTRGDHAQEERIWLEKLAEADRRRERYVTLAADGLMKKDELRAKLATLQEARETAHRELASIGERRERLLALELD